MGGSKKWLKSLVGLKSSKKALPSKKEDDLQQEKAPGERSKFWHRKNHSRDKTKVSTGIFSQYGSLKEEKAAICIQTEFRAFLARRALRSLKGLVRLQALVQGHEAKKQATITMRCMQSWIRVQAQVRARRVCMVTEGRIKQQRREHQLKLEAELHDLEVDWLDGAETMEEILARVQQREEAAVKRERAMAYAFSHQWRANSRSNLGHAGYEIDKTNWGWSWLERWIAARPWENRLLDQSAKDGSDNNKASNGRKNGQKHVTGVSVKRTVFPSTKNGQQNVKTCSPKKVPVHSRDNSFSNSKERSNIVDSEVKKRLSLPNSEKPIIPKASKPQPNGSQVVDDTISASQ
eukprot:Gb_18106 [translate_table: standard]